MGEIDRRQEVTKELKALMVRAHDGEKGALPKLREILDGTPSLARELLDPANVAERSAVGLYSSKDDLLAQEAIPRVLKEMRSELEGVAPSPLDRLLVERVVATWLQVQCYETLYAQNASKLTMAQGGAPPEAHRPGAQPPPLGRAGAGPGPQDGAGGADQHRGEADQHGRVAGASRYPLPRRRFSARVRERGEAASISPCQS